jgi:hypothetical protein
MTAKTVAAGYMRLPWRVICKMTRYLRGRKIAGIFGA